MLIHAFSWGQLRLPVSALVVVFGGLKHVLFEGRVDVLRHGLLESYRHGRGAKPLLPVYWERYWEEPMEDVRRRLGVARCTSH